MSKSNKPTSAKRTKTPTAPKSYAEAGDVTLTLRVPAPLLTMIDAKVAALNAKKLGRWSRNGYIVNVLEAELGGAKAEKP